VKIPSKIADLARVNKSLIQSAIQPNQVGFLILYVTNRCNFRCNFCFYSEEIKKGSKPDELTEDEFLQISEKVGPLIQLSLTGGEPFLRKELIQITKSFIDNTNVRYITIPTNASMPERMLRYLKVILPQYPNTYFRLSFSIEGIGEEHDEIRSMPGSFRKIRQSYDAISPLRDRYRNLVLDSNSVFTVRTEDTLLKTLEYLDVNFNFDNLSITYARGNVPDPELKRTSEQKYIQINDFLSHIERKKEKRFLYPVWRAARDVSREHLMSIVFQDKFVAPCVAGRKLVVVSETGEVFPCEILGTTMGNLRNCDYNIKDLLAQNENKKLRKWIVESQCKCSFECALAANVVWNYSQYPRLIQSSVRNIGNQ